MLQSGGSQRAGHNLGTEKRHRKRKTASVVDGENSMWELEF